MLTILATDDVPGLQVGWGLGLWDMQYAVAPWQVEFG